MIKILSSIFTAVLIVGTATAFVITALVFLAPFLTRLSEWWEGKVDDWYEKKEKKKGERNEQRNNIQREGSRK